MQRPATTHSPLGTQLFSDLELLGISIRKTKLVLDTHSRQYGQGKEAAWPPEMSLTILEPTPAGYYLQEHGEIQDGICLNCLDGSL